MKVVCNSVLMVWDVILIDSALSFITLCVLMDKMQFNVAHDRKVKLHSQFQEFYREIESTC